MYTKTPARNAGVFVYASNVFVNVLDAPVILVSSAYLFLLLECASLFSNNDDRQLGNQVV